MEQALNITEIKSNENSSEIHNSQIELIAKYVKKNNYNELQKLGPQTNHDLNDYQYPGRRGNYLIHESLKMDNEWNIFLWLHENGADLTTKTYSNGPTGYHLLSKRIGQYNDKLALDFLINLTNHNNLEIKRQAKIHLARAWAIRLMEKHDNPQIRQQCLNNCVALISDANFYGAMLFNLSHVDEKQRFIWGIIGLHPKFAQLDNDDFKQIRRWGIDHLCTAARYGHEEALNLLETHYVNDPELILFALSNIITAYLRQANESLTTYWIEQLNNSFVDQNPTKELIEIYIHILSDLEGRIQENQAMNNCKFTALKGFANRWLANPTTNQKIEDWKTLVYESDAFISFIYACYILKYANSINNFKQATTYFKAAAKKGFPISLAQVYPAKLATQWEKSQGSVKDKTIKLFNGLINSSLENSIIRKLKILKDPQADQVFVCLIQALLETHVQDIRALDIQKMVFVLQRLLGFNSLHLTANSNNDSYMQVLKNLSQIDKNLTNDPLLHAPFTKTWNPNDSVNLKTKALILLNENAEKSKLADFLNFALKQLPDDATILNIVKKLTDVLYEFSRFDDFTGSSLLLLLSVEIWSDETDATF